MNGSRIVLPDSVLTTDKDIIVPSNHVVTIVEPLDSIKEMYSEKLNGSTGNSTDK